MKIVKFNDYLVESESQQIPTTYLIKVNGEVIEEQGLLTFNVGIFDGNDNKYVACIADGKLYTTLTDPNKIAKLFTYVNSDTLQPDESLKKDDDLFDE